MAERKELLAVWVAGIGGIGLVLLVAVLAFYVGRGCSPSPQPVEDLGIDAGPGEAEIGARLDAALREAEEEIRRIEVEHEADIAAFEANQRDKFETVRAEGPEALARWFSDFNRRLRDGGTR